MLVLDWDIWMSAEIGDPRSVLSYRISEVGLEFRACTREHGH